MQTDVPKVATSRDVVEYLERNGVRQPDGGCLLPTSYANMALLGELLPYRHEQTDSNDEQLRGKKVLLHVRQYSPDPGTPEYHAALCAKLAEHRPFGLYFSAEAIRHLRLAVGEGKWDGDTPLGAGQGSVDSNVTNKTEIFRGDKVLGDKVMGDKRGDTHSTITDSNVIIGSEVNGSFNATRDDRSTNAASNPKSTLDWLRDTFLMPLIVLLLGAFILWWIGLPP